MDEAAECISAGGLQILVDAGIPVPTWQYVQYSYV